MPSAARHELAEAVPHVAAATDRGGGMSGKTRRSAGAIRAIRRHHQVPPQRGAPRVADGPLDHFDVWQYGGAPLISTQCPVSTRIPRA